MAKMTDSPAPLIHKGSGLLRVLLGSCLLLFIGGALSIPYVYETQTLWYKLGMDKTILRAGQMAGLLSAIMLFVQVLLATRGKFLKHLFGVAALIRWHRNNGLVVSFMALSHVILVLAPEGFANLPIGMKFWPEMVGGLLLLCVLFMAIFSQFRQKLGLDYRRWKAVHQPLGYLIIIIVGIHVLFVSESFQYTLPRTALIVTIIGVLGAVIVSKWTTGKAK